MGCSADMDFASETVNAFELGTGFSAETITKPVIAAAARAPPASCIQNSNESAAEHERTLSRHPTGARSSTGIARSTLIT